mmetsp:Transcript_14223/g.49265  ORF Transcript_14223/g.49265 Transcript_14223/m.49265 type:complete len:205 (+) Transcript_14223:493-1107(+)
MNASHLPCCAAMLARCSAGVKRLLPRSATASSYKSHVFFAVTHLALKLTALAEYNLATASTRRCDVSRTSSSSDVKSASFAVITSRACASSSIASASSSSPPSSSTPAGITRPAASAPRCWISSVSATSSSTSFEIFRTDVACALRNKTEALYEFSQRKAKTMGCISRRTLQSRPMSDSLSLRVFEMMPSAHSSFFCTASFRRS